MTEKEQELIDKASGLIKEIDDYISSIEDWPYYFLSTRRDINPQILEVIDNHPQGWKDYISFEITDFSNTTADIRIKLKNEEDTVLHRYINLVNFNQTVERNKKLFEGDIRALQIKELESEIEYHRKKLSEKEQMLMELEMTKSK